MSRPLWQEKYVYGQIVTVGKVLEMILKIVEDRVENSKLVDAVAAAKAVYIANPTLENFKKALQTEKARVSHTKRLMSLEMKNIALKSRVSQRGINVAKWSAWESRWDVENVGRVAIVSGKMLEVVALIAEKDAIDSDTSKPLFSLYSYRMDAAAVDAKLPVLVAQIDSILEAA